jgi:hypothetical protein
MPRNRGRAPRSVTVAAARQKTSPPVHTGGTAQPANWTGMPDSLKTTIESLSGFAMDDVRVHFNSLRPARLGPVVMARGTGIHPGLGHERHLPHEAWHVVQQKQGRVAPTLPARRGHQR